MIKSLIFDLVGVIGDFGTKQIFQHFIELGATDVWELNNEMDLGRLTGEEFLQAVHERCIKAARECGTEGVTLKQLRQEYVAPMTLPREFR